MHLVEQYLKRNDHIDDLNLLANGQSYNFYGIDHYRFKLDNMVWEAEEDPDDGYRSYLGSVLRTQSEGIFYSHPIARIIIQKFNDANFEGFVFKDLYDGHEWLTFGTDCSDSYYPNFVFDYKPKYPESIYIFRN